MSHDDGCEERMLKTKIVVPRHLLKILSAYTYSWITHYNLCVYFKTNMWIVQERILMRKLCIRSEWVVISDTGWSAVLSRHIFIAETSALLIWECCCAAFNLRGIPCTSFHCAPIQIHTANDIIAAYPPNLATRMDNSVHVQVHLGRFINMTYIIRDETASRSKWY